MSEHSHSIVDWLIKAAAAVIPALLATLVTLAWSNSHTLVVLTSDVEHVESELAHLRELVEQRSGIKP